MIDEFEDHCWQDVVPAETLELYRHYKRPIGVGPRAALLAIDLYELAYQGGPLPVAEVSMTYPSSCGENAHRAIEPTRRLFAAARAAGLPILYTTGDTRPDSKPTLIRATKRQGMRSDPSVFAIRPEFAPMPGDVVITKQRASAFFGTPLIAHLTLLGVQTVIVCGESTSGCVRASTTDGYSYGFHMVMAEECCFDRSMLSHKLSLFDLHHKYADVMHTDDIVSHLDSLALKEAV
ncbi:isochorismatase family protein [Aurantimonas sp. MSK8Z-1]|uniref:isochorismatase family protein n=1 Tax=Mangrovibrevibacter kandeliae TaxID=2968473 RepID=UPI00211830DD|nr:isochorismatase family protein [Aurantimonas sp. MSK8Z-1]MCW4115483.1 isochorismatase family protein [Aurantimonas sp. MSK8Z-1]